MRLPQQFRLVLTGERDHVVHREAIISNLDHYLAHILAGGQFDADLLRAWRITIEIEDIGEKPKPPRPRLPG